MNLQVTPRGFGGAFDLSSIDKGQRERVLAALEDLSVQAAGVGIDDGDLMRALGKKRDTYDPFGMFCNIWGTMIRYLGSAITLALSLFAMFLLFDWAIDKGRNLYNELKSFLNDIPVIGWFIKDSPAGTSAAAPGQIEQMAPKAMQAFFLGLLPTAVAGASFVAFTGLKNAGGSPPVVKPIKLPGVGETQETAALLQRAGAAFRKASHVRAGRADASFDDEDVAALAEISGLSHEDVLEHLTS